MFAKVLIFVVILFTWARSFAAGSTGDIPGCHLDEDTESYSCESGPLAGRDFITRDEAREALEDFHKREKERAAEIVDITPPPTPEDKPVEVKTAPAEHLTILSWNMRALTQE